MKKFTFLLLFLFQTAAVVAQREYVIELDPTTGTFVKKGGYILGVNWIYPHVRTYDEVNGRMIFQGGTISPDRLFTVDVSNGSVVTNPVFPASGGPGVIRAPQFDNTNGTLYGLHYDSLAAVFYLATIDPATGLFTPIGNNPIDGLIGTSQGMDTYDELHHKYLVYSLQYLFVVDAVSGNSDSIRLALQPGDGLAHMCFHNGNDTLYALLYENSSQQFFLSWIDRVTGSITKIGAGTNLASGNGSATIDYTNRRYIFVYLDQGFTHLSVMDLDNGSVLFHNTISLAALDNVANLSYDNTRQALYAIHWDNDLENPTGISNKYTRAMQISPNPATEMVAVRLPMQYERLQVQLINAFGQTIKAYDCQQVQQFELPIQSLSSGMYFLKIDTGTETLSVRFMRK